MATNDLTMNQISTVLNAIVGQATGNEALAQLDGSNFTTVAQTALKTGYDNLIQSISQVLSQTIFSIRPYDAKFTGIQVSNQRYGNMVRKLNISDSDWEDDERQELVDDESVDMYKVRKPKVLQTNFYGQNVYQRHYTVFRDQLDVAFSSPAELGRFWTMVTSNVSDMINQAHESLRRALLVNYVAGLYTIGTTNEPQIVKCLTEYNARTGNSFTKEDIYKPENYTAFMRWLSARIETAREMLTERSLIYHVNVTDKEVMRHTPRTRQRFYMFAPERAQIEANTLSTLFHEDYVARGFRSNERVNFWQSITDPEDINIAPVYMDTSGEIQTGSAVSNSNIIGVLFDEEALGVTTVNEWSAPTPLNAAGGYYNIFYHFTDRYWTDYTENGIVFVME